MLCLLVTGRFVAAMLIYLPAGSQVNIVSIVTSSSSPTTSLSTSISSTGVSSTGVSSTSNNTTGSAMNKVTSGTSTGVSVSSDGATRDTTAGIALSTLAVSTRTYIDRRLLRRQLLDPNYLTIIFTVSAYVSSVGALTSLVQSTTTIAHVATTLNQYYNGITITTPQPSSSSTSPGCNYNCGSSSYSVTHLSTHTTSQHTYLSTLAITPLAPLIHTLQISPPFFVHDVNNTHP